MTENQTSDRKRDAKSATKIKCPGCGNETKMRTMVTTASREVELCTMCAKAFTKAC